MILASAAALKLEGLSLAEKALCLVLAHYADAKGQCWPSRRLILAGTGMAKTTLDRALRRLEARGLIRRERQTRDHGGSAPTLITLLFVKAANG